MVKVTYKSKANKLVKVWFTNSDSACQYVKEILLNVEGFIKVEYFEEVTEE